MNQTMTGMDFKIREVAGRVRELREISGFTVEEMAQRTDLSVEEYIQCEAGNRNLSIAFLYRCTLSFGVDMSDLLEGRSAKLRAYDLTRRGEGQRIEEAHHMVGWNLAADFRNRIALPLYMEMKYREGAEYEDIDLVTHEGQECDIVIRGHMKIQIGGHTEILHAGDTIYYDSSTPHGMIAVDGEDCAFYAIVLSNSAAREGEQAPEIANLDLQSGRLEFANAAHNPPLLKKSGEPFMYMDYKKFRRGLVLGGLAEIRYSNNEIFLSQGDTLFLYTDGVTEAANHDLELYGEERLLKCMEDNYKLAPEALLKAVRNDIDDFASGMEQYDDITMVVLKIKA